uniref:hypothetical protein n=1 Tax=Segatella hominis TaxID=2518605 RepID=UPI004024E1BF
MANDNNKILATTDDSQIVLYQPDGSIRLEVKLDQDTVWLNRQQMAQLFGRDIKTIGKHINNALHEELASDPTGANFATIENSKNPTAEFNDALSYVKTLKAKGGKPIPADENSLDALVDKKYAL